MSILEIDALRVQFQTERSSVEVVRDVSFSVEAGETVAVVGESGSGKTVTALAVMGLIDPPGAITAGDIYLDGRSLVGLPDDQYRQVRGASWQWCSRTR